MFLVNLETFVKREIRFRQFDGKRETQGFDPESVSWVNKNSFRVQLKIYGGDDKLLRSKSAQVNLTPFAITYPGDQNAVRTQPSRQTRTQTSRQRAFTISRECDGGACHFEVVSFNYGRGLTISVGHGNDSLSYYFSVETTTNNVSKDYVYSGQPEEYFVEKESRQRVDAAFNRLLLDVYNLGKYIINNNVAIRNRKFSETGQFAVLANLRRDLEGAKP